MIAQGDPFKTAPRITRDHFAQVIHTSGNPDLATERDPGEYWDTIKGYGIDPLFLLGMFNHESNLGVNGTATQTRSWGNTRAPSFGIDYTPSLIAGRSGEFPVFRTWLDGCVTTAARLVEPSWVYANRTSMADIFLFDGPVWAPAGDLNDPGGYLRSVLDFMNANADGSAPPAPTPQPGGNVPNIIDVRGQLPTNPGGGSGQKMAAPVGLVLHYSAVHYDDSRDIIEIMKSEAAYQIGPYLREYSLAYHYVVDWRDGQVYQTRDEDDILWHVGSWVPGGNGTGISIHLPGDADTRLTDAALAGLVGLFDWLRAKHNIPPEMVRPHRFFGTSTCPGDYLSNIVYQYNRGEIGGVPVATAIKDDVTGKTLANAMYEFYMRTGGLDVHGRPVTEEFQGIWPDDPKGSPKRTIQITERSVLGLFDENKDPYRVQVLRLGATFAAEHGFKGEGIPTLAAPPVMKGAKK